ncbi:MAG: hypothetical protein ACR2OY_05115 [Boseongicola sp.]
MSGAIWLIMYDLASPDEPRYLSWFHDVHIPEKLARPGYAWAAHYELVALDGTPVTLSGGPSDGTRGFAAFFGGTDTRTFLDPSPAQIKPNQPPLTREMMGLRIGSDSLIAAQEWRVEESAAPSYAVLEVVTCDTDGHDEDYGAWCIQSLCPHLKSTPGFEVMAKLLSTTTAAKHLSVTSFGSLGDVEAHRRQAPRDAWSERVQGYRRQGDQPPMLCRRIWRAP